MDWPFGVEMPTHVKLFSWGHLQGGIRQDSIQMAGWTAARSGSHDQTCDEPFQWETNQPPCYVDRLIPVSCLIQTRPLPSTVAI
ncbi:hypothetical protein XCCB100_1054 [Xanthomonas campestris pv. campestris]|uniref:Uncharacterized protein n=1 Tax=Xanthomonas campestris pv. campestris (strain B100) TaxID=509169 RepID=B0RPL7_XANCB|nr:hypothetical protein XCCB100_1054 [Xanthomonas campestris pv. campestris]